MPRPKSADRGLRDALVEAARLLGGNAELVAVSCGGMPSEYRSGLHAALEAVGPLVDNGESPSMERRLRADVVLSVHEAVFATLFAMRHSRPYLRIMEIGAVEISRTVDALANFISKTES